MTMPGAWVWLISGYALLLLVFAWGFDTMAKRTSERAAQWRTGKFVYHEDHDAWKCPQDQWLWPTSFDRSDRVMRYRATPSIWRCFAGWDCRSGWPAAMDRRRSGRKLSPSAPPASRSALHLRSAANRALPQNSAAL